MATQSASFVKADALVFSDDSSVDQVRREAFQKLLKVVDELSELEGQDAIRLVEDSSVKSLAIDTVPVNSIICFVKEKDPVLVILGSEDRIDCRKLERCLEGGSDDERILVQLAPSFSVEKTCGFPPGCVPPLGHTPKNLTAIIDAKLVEESGMEAILKGGGGHVSTTCLVRLETLLRIEGTQVAEVSVGILPSIQPVDKEESLTDRPKPFFPYEPPPIDVAELCYNDKGSPNPLQPMDVTILGRVSGVRRMTRRLVFCDLAPPDYVGRGTKQDQYDLPWRSGVDGLDMAAQLIAGKTLCKALGDVDGPAALKKLKPGQLILVKGRTNVGNRDSLGNWIQKRSFDIVVHSFDILEQGGLAAASIQEKEQNSASSTLVIQKQKATKQIQTSSELRRLQLAASLPEMGAGVTFLSLADVFPNSKEPINVVDSIEGVQEFRQQLEAAKEVIAGIDDAGTNATGLNKTVMTGIDCEWKPSFMMATPFEPQPVLVMQVSLQPLERVFVLDIQSMLRSLLSPDEPMNELEAAFSEAIEALLESSKFLKIGFQLLADLKRLAGSYPHIPGFRQVNGVVEMAGIARKSLQLAKIRNSRTLSTSLARLTEFLMEKPMTKEQQVSDWSFRPLTPEQLEYAGLDAAITPLLLEKSLSISGASWMQEDEAIGRWKDDSAFSKAVSSFRFLFLDSTDPIAVRKLKAKRIVGSRYVVTQQWVTGYEPPMLPSAPEGGADMPYRDVHGIFRMPAGIVAIDETRVGTLVGKRLGKAKDRCLDALLTGNPSMPADSKLEYHQRAGYVEFQDVVAMFVNMPTNSGESRPKRGYPNEWQEDGKFMTWFLREHEWNGGKTSVGEKLLGREDYKNPILFVRMGRGDFLCCGQCKVSEPDTEENSTSITDWALVELRLELLDWAVLSSNVDFRALVDVTVDNSDDNVANDASAESDLWELSDKLAQLVLKGDFITSMYKASKRAPINGERRSFHFGLVELKRALSESRSDNVMRAIKAVEEKLDELQVES